MYICLSIVYHIFYREETKAIWRMCKSEVSVIIYKILCRVVSQKANEDK